MRELTLHKAVETAVTVSPRVLETAAMFGLGVDDEHRLELVPEVSVPLPKHGIVFVTGPSGGGKTTILRLIESGARQAGWPVVRFEDLAAPKDLPLVDLFPEPDFDLQASMGLLASAGLGDAFVMLRRPTQLSDGQRWRLNLARAMAAADAAGQSAIIITDEFAATLDRLTAANVARAAAKWIRRSKSSGHTLICATTHDDLLEPLAPDVLVFKGLGEAVEVVTRS